MAARVPVAAASPKRRRALAGRCARSARPCGRNAVSKPTSQSRRRHRGLPCETRFDDAIAEALDDLRQPEAHTVFVPLAYDIDEQQQAVSLRAARRKASAFSPVDKWCRAKLV